MSVLLRSGYDSGEGYERDIKLKWWVGFIYIYIYLYIYIYIYIEIRICGSNSSRVEVDPILMDR